MLNLGDVVKKIVFIFLVLILFSFYVIEGKKEEKKKNVLGVESSKNAEMRGLFISYMELNTYVKGKTREESEENIKSIISKTKKNKFNTLILQVRSYDDAIYKTDLFPVSKSIILKDGTSYDVLDFFLKEAGSSKIDVYVWINPFRITRPNEELVEGSYPYKYKDTTTIARVENIYYYNPASDNTKEHIVEGIRELLKNYQFKGLLFDDYFYPSDEIDKVEYTEYLKGHSITKQEYHLQIINELIKEVYQEIKKINKEVEFGISPDGNIENNYSKNFADVKTWGRDEGYIDFLMPQLYYGFNNTAKPFRKTMQEWNELVVNKKKLYYALAFYKVGKADAYAKDGISEWILNDDIIKKQIIMLRNAKNYNGFSLFRYDSLFNEVNYTKSTANELDNLQQVLKK